MKKTPLHAIHEKLGAKMTDFAGYDMPISYSDIKSEHFTVRNGVGVFDVSHMGEFIVRGKQAADLVQWISSNDVTTLEIGQAQYSCMPNEKGGIVDDLLIYKLPEENCSEGETAFMLVVNASNIQKDWDWIQSQNSFDCQMIDISKKTGLLAVQGPKADATLQKLTDSNLADIPYYSFAKMNFAGLENILVSRTGYTGAGGFEIYADNDKMETIWKKVFEAGEEFEIKPIGLGARDTLRLEMGYCLYGNDINDETIPNAAGLAWITKTNTDFVGKEAILKAKEEGLKQRLCAMLLEGRRIPRQGYEIQNEQGEKIGVVTSGSLSPTLEQPIALGYVNVPLHKRGNTVFVAKGKKTFEAKIVKLPFVK